MTAASRPVPWASARCASTRRRAAGPVGLRRRRAVRSDRKKAVLSRLAGCARLQLRHARLRPALRLLSELGDLAGAARPAGGRRRRRMSTRTIWQPMPFGGARGSWSPPTTSRSSRRSGPSRSSRRPARAASAPRSSPTATARRRCSTTSCRGSTSIRSTSRASTTSSTASSEGGSNRSSTRSARCTQRQVWLEIVTLLVPGFNDSTEELTRLAEFVASVSIDIPWHVTAFHQDYKMTDAANTTAAAVAERRRDRARRRPAIRLLRESAGLRRRVRGHALRVLLRPSDRSRWLPDPRISRHGNRDLSGLRHAPARPLGSRLLGPTGLTTSGPSLRAARCARGRPLTSLAGGPPRFARREDRASRGRKNPARTTTLPRRVDASRGLPRREARASRRAKRARLPAGREGRRPPPRAQRAALYAKLEPCVWRKSRLRVSALPWGPWPAMSPGSLPWRARWRRPTSRSPLFPSRSSAATRRKTSCSGAGSSTGSAASSSASPRRPRNRRPSLCWASRSPSAGTCSTAPRIVHRGQILGFVPKEKLPTYNVFYEARTFSHGGPEARARRGRRPARRLHLRVRLRPRRDRGLRRRLVARWPDAPPLLLRRRDRRQPLGLAVSHGRRRHAPRDARDPRGGQPDRPVYANVVGGNDGLIFDGGGLVFQNGRLVLEAPRFREGWRPRSSISIAPAACAWRTRPGGPTARTSGCSGSTSR